MWKMIDGYAWPYRINEKAVVEREVHPGYWRPITPFNSDRLRRLFVHIKRADGRRVNIPVKTLMRDAFMGGERPGMVVSFRNGMYTDCELENLYFTTHTNIGKRLGGAGRKSVEKIDRDGNVIALYASVSEAARKNHMSRKAIQNRLKKRNKWDPFLLDGTTYRYER